MEDEMEGIDGHAVNCWCDDCMFARDMQTWPSAEKTIDAFRAIANDRAAKMIDGVFVDMQTANAIVLVYDAVSDERKDQMMALSVARMGALAWRCVK